MENIKSFFTSKPTILALFTIISTLLAIPLIILVAQEKQTTRQFAAEKQNESVKGAMTGPISGYVYNDSNNNGIRDPEEKPVYYATIRVNTKVNDAVSTRELKTDSFGYFIFRTENQLQGLQIKLVLPDGFKTSSPNPQTITSAQKQILEFGVTGSTSITPKPIRVDPTKYPKAKVYVSPYVK